MAGLTEVVQFNEPYANLYQFEIERASYPAFIDYLDLNGLQYTTYPDRPDRATLLAELQ